MASNLRKFVETNNLEDKDIVIYDSQTNETFEVCFNPFDELEASDDPYDKFYLAFAEATACNGYQMYPLREQILDVRIECDISEFWNKYCSKYFTDDCDVLDILDLFIGNCGMKLYNKIAGDVLND